MTEKLLNKNSKYGDRFHDRTKSIMKINSHFLIFSIHNKSRVVHVKCSIGFELVAKKLHTTNNLAVHWSASSYVSFAFKVENLSSMDSLKLGSVQAWLWQVGRGEISVKVEV